jgi:hypothetical protein
MEKKGSSTERPVGVTRRQALRTAGMVLAVAPLASAAEVCSLHLGGNHLTKFAAAQGQGTSSVFQDSCYYEQEAKASAYDAGIVYPIFALWLMLTTGNWDECLANPDWRKRLALELGAVNPKINYANLFETIYQRVYPSGQLSPAFHDVRQAWQEFLEDPGGGEGDGDNTLPYGVFPCPGGATLLQIAHSRPTI